MRNPDTSHYLAAIINELMASGSLGSGTPHGERVAHDASKAGRVLDMTAPVVSFEVLRSTRDMTRDMTAAGAQGSNYLVGKSSTAAVDVLRDYVIPLQADAWWLDGLTGNITIPRVTADASAYWLTLEDDQITASQPTIGQVALTPKLVGAHVQLSRLLSLQSRQASPLITRHLLGAVGFEIQRAALQGSGNMGQPLGLVNTAGVGTQSGTALAWAGITAMLKQVEDAGAQPTAWIADPATAKILRGRPRVTGSDGMIWDHGKIGDFPAYATSAVPTGTLILGDWRQFVMAAWGDGISLAANPYHGFTSGVTAVRATLAFDCAAIRPAAFSIASSVT